MHKPEILTFECHGDQLLGILHRPAQITARGVLMIVGGPQYRIGSHRQFILIARALADAGIPVFRFDYRGMGDSEGRTRDFEEIGDDIRVAIDTFTGAVPGMHECVLWGLCDAVSAAMFYARYDQRVKGMVLLNPWVRTEAGRAKSYLRYYYTRRMFDRDFWQSMLFGKVNIVESVSSLLDMIRKVFLKNRAQNIGTVQSAQQGDPGSLPERMCNGISAYSERVLFILSGNDLTAGEFKNTVAASGAWQTVMKRKNVERRDLQDANHTFSRQDWRQQVINWTADWTKSW